MGKDNLIGKGTPEMARLIVHIGQPKTGTSTLQDTLLQSRAALLEHGVLYPKPLVWNNHTTSVAHLGGLDVAPILDKIKHKGDDAKLLQESAEAWALIKKEIATHPADTIVLSSESFSDIPPDGNVSNFIKALNALSDDITIVAYLRAPASYYLSLKQQDLRHIGIASAPVHGPWFRPMLEPFMNVNGIKLDVHVFDRAQLFDQDIVTDFAHRYLPKTAHRALISSGKDLNTSVTAESMAVLEDIWTGTTPAAFQHAGRPVYEISGILGKVDDQLPGKSKLSYRPGIRALIDNTPTDLDWLAANFGVTFDGLASENAAANIALSELTNVRAMCEVDEERYERLWAAFIERLVDAKETPIAKPAIATRKTGLRKIAKDIWGAQKYIARARKRVIRGIKSVLGGS